MMDIEDCGMNAFFSPGVYDLRLKAADHYDNIIGDHDQNDSLSLCQHSCEDTFVGAEDKQSKLAWCNQGALFWQERLKFTIMVLELKKMNSKLKPLGLVSASRTGAIAMTRGAEIFS